MALADFIVVEVMRGRDFHAAGAKFGVTVIIADNRNASPNQRQLNVLPNQGLVTLIARMHGHGGITEHRFRARGGYH